MKGYANSHLVLSPRDLAALLDNGATPRPLLLDLRPPEAYAAGHIPAAIHLDLWGVSLIDTDPAPLQAFMWMIEHVMAVHGVDATTPVVVYDEQSGVRAARAFWFLEHFGHPSARVLDGGFNAWSAAGLPETRDAAPPPKSEWTGRRDQRTLATWKDVKNAIGSAMIRSSSTPEATPSTRAPSFRARRGGAVPGAVHIEWTRNLCRIGRIQAGR